MTKDLYHYLEHSVSTGDDAADKLAFLFHGTGGDETQFTGLASELMPGWNHISPRGDVSEFGASRFFKRLGEGNYDMPDLALRTKKMVRFLNAHLDDRQPAETLGLGYSNGANILASTLFEPGKRFDKVILMHPLIPFEPEPNSDLEGVEILITAGKRDPICPPGHTLHLEHWLKNQGAIVFTHWHDGGHEIMPEELQVIDRFVELGLTSNQEGTTTHVIPTHAANTP